MIEKLEGPTADFATNGLPQLTAAVVSLQRSADSLNAPGQRGAARTRAALIGKAPAKEVKVQP